MPGRPIIESPAMYRCIGWPLKGLGSGFSCSVFCGFSPFLPGLPLGVAVGVGTTTATCAAPAGPGSGRPSATAVSFAGRSRNSQWLTSASGFTSASRKLRAPLNGISSAVFFIAGALNSAPRNRATSMATRALAAVRRRRP